MENSYNNASAIFADKTTAKHELLPINRSNENPTEKSIDVPAEVLPPVERGGGSPKA